MFLSQCAKKMLPSTLSALPSALHRPPPVKFLDFSPSNRLPNSNDTILIAGRRSNSHLGRRFRSSGSKSMPELVKIEAIRREDAVAEEAETILGGEILNSELSFRWSDVEGVINRLSKWSVAALFGLVVLWKHDAEALWLVMGSVINSWLSITLKKIINHERPVPGPGLKPDPGMPSSHAQSIFYATVFVIVSLFEWLGINLFTLIMGIFIIACGSYLTWLRVSQRLHTVSQVVVGALLGCTFCIAWFWLWYSFIAGAFISSIWIRIPVVLGAVSSCLAFMIYIVKNWLKYEPQI